MSFLIPPRSPAREERRRIRTSSARVGGFAPAWRARQRAEAQAGDAGGGEDDPGPSASSSPSRRERRGGEGEAQAGGRKRSARAGPDSEPGAEAAAFILAAGRRDGPSAARGDAPASGGRDEREQPVEVGPEAERAAELILTAGQVEEVGEEDAEDRAVRAILDAGR